MQVRMYVYICRERERERETETEMDRWMDGKIHTYIHTHTNVSTYIHTQECGTHSELMQHPVPSDGSPSYRQLLQRQKAALDAES